ncbi:tRNA lysidine(34) synthetase TilS [Capnocytophaga sp. oral taxon 338]|uniref:tRNA lysidine(34) synthetase TilS n=1 Tax=Capnocytophaga sp. oral taxon 338 TaxID=710239 RepID=UPI000202F84F|nr:tRNA lysidine(34) synthetase TilS [Capnocytophaga sp. oral taxon 338]EGD33674.1 tRNA(Ile)-lysidine synthase (tRNA(Ile)-lysidinesynthetase) [Capnocytophaga sp. oral taxon 338 str. F0234]
MLASFQNHLQRNFPFLWQKRIILAISGGIDSVVLAYLLKELQIPFLMAHCNFQLRGEESEGDQHFVEALAQKLSMPLEVKRFATKEYGKTHALNTQLAARVLRYEWFEQIRQKKGYDYILTAHQANDSWETFLINTSRGTGLKGLLGVPVQNNTILRPLLGFSREEILAFAKENNIIWREDSSNNSDAYTRNKIRHHISPILSQIHPNFLKNLEKTQHILQLTYSFIEEQLEKYRKKCFIIGTPIIFLVNILKDHPHRSFLLYELLSPYGFTGIEILERFLYASTGKQIFSNTHRILSNRGQWLILPIEKNTTTNIFYIHKEDKSIDYPLTIHLEEISAIEKSKKGTIFLDKEKIQFPLCIRKRKKGDIFYPYGMNGKKKTLSKYFKDEKYSLYEKENQWLLVDNTDQILWVIGKRPDERFLATKNTKRILDISIKTIQ